MADARAAVQAGRVNKDGDKVMFEGKRIGRLTMWWIGQTTAETPPRVAAQCAMHTIRGCSCRKVMLMHLDRDDVEYEVELMTWLVAPHIAASRGVRLTPQGHELAAAP